MTDEPLATKNMVSGEVNVGGAVLRHYLRKIEKVYQVAIPIIAKKSQK